MIMIMIVMTVMDDDDDDDDDDEGDDDEVYNLITFTDSEGVIRLGLIGYGE